MNQAQALCNTFTGISAAVQRSVFAVLMWAIWPSRAGALVGLATAKSQYLPRDTYAWAVALPSDLTRRSRFGALGRRNEQTWTLS